MSSTRPSMVINASAKPSDKACRSSISLKNTNGSTAIEVSADVLRGAAPRRAGSAWLPSAANTASAVA